MALDNTNKSFPYSKESDDLTSKILNEDNITGIIKHICDNDSFVLEKIEEDSTRIIKFILEGYYFEISVPTTNVPLYAKINYEENENYIGNTLDSITINSDGEKGYFQLLDGDGNIPDSSKIKFSSASLSLPTNINCGSV